MGKSGTYINEGSSSSNNWQKQRQNAILKRRKFICLGSDLVVDQICPQKKLQFNKKKVLIDISNRVPSFLDNKFFRYSTIDKPAFQKEQARRLPLNSLVHKDKGTSFPFPKLTWNELSKTSNADNFVGDVKIEKNNRFACNNNNIQTKQKTTRPYYVDDAINLDVVCGTMSESLMIPEEKEKVICTPLNYSPIPTSSEFGDDLFQNNISLQKNYISPYTSTIEKFQIAETSASHHKDIASHHKDIISVKKIIQNNNVKYRKNKIIVDMKKNEKKNKLNVTFNRVAEVHDSVMPWNRPSKTTSVMTFISNSQTHMNCKKNYSLPLFVCPSNDLVVETNYQRFAQIVKSGQYSHSRCAPPLHQKQFTNIQECGVIEKSRSGIYLS